MRDEWSALLRASVAENVFLTWEWITTWWDLYADGARLYILTARTGAGVLVGIAPLKRTGKRRCGVPIGDLVEFVGYGGDVTPDRLDFIARAGWDSQVVAAFASHLLGDPSICGIDLRPLSAQSRTCEGLTMTLGAEAGLVRCTHDSVAPQLELPQSVDAFLASQSRNYRKKMREYENRCERELAARVRICRTQDELGPDMTALAKLHRKRWRTHSRAFRSQRYVTFHQRVASLMLEQNALRLFSFEAGDTRLAALYCFAYGKRYYFYQSGRDPKFAKHRVGLVLMHRAILHAIGERAAVFDFLRGAEEYKYRWATGEARNMRLTYVSARPGRLTAGLRSVGFGLTHVSRWFNGITTSAAPS